MSPSHNRPSLAAELESIGLELRVVDSHLSVLNRRGHEVLTLPLDALDRAREAGTPRSPWVFVLPADLLARD
jgi:hypothetical protein